MAIRLNRVSELVYIFRTSSSPSAPHQHVALRYVVRLRATDHFAQVANHGLKALVVAGSRSSLRVARIAFLQHMQDIEQRVETQRPPLGLTDRGRRGFGEVDWQENAVKPKNIYARIVRRLCATSSQLFGRRKDLVRVFRVGVLAVAATRNG